MKRTAFLLGLVALSMTPPATAQTSIYGTLGLGFPGRAVGVRARALGGGFVQLDPASAVNPATVAGYRQLIATATTASAFRNYTTGDSTIDGLQSTRFPLAILGGPFQGTPLSFSLSFSTYLNRTFDVVTGDTIPIRGEPVAITDQLTSDGSVVDIRGAVAWRVDEGFSVGVGLHLLSGVTTNSFTREFANGSFASLRRRDKVSFTGVGVSLGINLTASERLRLGASARLNGDMKVGLPDTEIGRTPLPKEIGAGIFFLPHRAVRVSSSVLWRSWSDSRSGLTSPNAVQAFDTWEIGMGVEIGGDGRGIVGIPIRLGFRYAQLPYSPTKQQPHEIDLALGSGLSFAAGRANIEFALERVFRDGGGASERAWQLSFGLLVAP